MRKKRTTERSSRSGSGRPAGKGGTKRGGAGGVRKKGKSAGRSASTEGRRGESGTRSGSESRGRETTSSSGARRRPSGKRSTSASRPGSTRASAPRRGREDRRAEPPQERSSDQKGERLNKVIALAGVASRRNADELIAAGKVRVNGKRISELGTRVLPWDEITVDGDPLQRQVRSRYILLNKPKDSITTLKDEGGRRTVLDLVPVRERIFPVGRLDRNTTGVLLLTNDGELANRMTHPRYEIERTYRASLDKPLEHGDAEKIAAGLDIGRGEHSAPCYISIDARNGHDVEVTVTEGKNREIRRMFEAVGYDVNKLNRKSYGGLVTSGMARGEWRELSRAEVRDLRSRLGLRPRGGV